MISAYQKSVFQDNAAECSGFLKYLGYNHDIELQSEDFVFDVEDSINNTISHLDGKYIEYGQDMECLYVALAADGQHDNPLTMVKAKDRYGAHIINRREGFSNFSAYLNIWLENNNARNVTFRVTPFSFAFWVDPSEDVFALKFASMEYYPKIPDGKEKEICKVGEGKDCCIFTLVEGDGFKCSKFTTTGRVFLDRLAKGEINAGRIGNCKVVGSTKPGQARNQFDRLRGEKREDRTREQPAVDA